MRRKKRRWSLLVVVILAVVAATGAYAYANSINSVSPPRVGFGSSDPIGKYRVADEFNDITYNLNATNPQSIDSVTININITGASTPTLVRVQLVSGGTWYSTSDTSAWPTITCPTPGAAATTVNGDTLRLVVIG